MGVNVTCDSCDAVLGDEAIRLQVGWRGTFADICIPCFMTKTSFPDTLYKSLERPGLPPPPLMDVPTRKTPKWTRAYPPAEPPRAAQPVRIPEPPMVEAETQQ